MAKAKRKKKKQAAPSHALPRLTDEDIAAATTRAVDRPDEPDFVHNAKLREKALKIVDWYTRCPYNPKTGKGIRVADYKRQLGVSTNFLREVWSYFELGDFPESEIEPTKQPGCEAAYGELAPRYLPPTSKVRPWA